MQWDRRPSRALLGLAVLGVLWDQAADASPEWPDTLLTRMEVLATLQTLNADLLSHDSATLTLDGWCSRHRLAPPGAQVIAERVEGQDKPPTADDLKLLGVSRPEEVRYRRVRLRCGDKILSQADNWYVPARLTDSMNRLLNTTDGSFGRIVQPLHFRRKTLSATLLWSPLPSDWDEVGVVPPPPNGMTIHIPHALIEHRAVLSTPDGTPFSEVVETYTDAVLEFPPPIVER